MQLQSLKWGNSLAIRITNAYARKLMIDQDSVLDLYVLEGALMAIHAKQ